MEENRGAALSGGAFTETYMGKVGELTLKGTNIHMFENRLLGNARLALAPLPARAVLRSGRLYVETTREAAPCVEAALDTLVGITGWARVMRTEKTLGALREAVRAEGLAARARGARTFKIEARREDKSFPLSSYQIACETAGALFDNGTLAVDVHSPDVVINIEVRDVCYVYTDETRTSRGLPVGVSGRGLLLLSGGIDSPVAGYRMMRRGMKVDALYFHSYPYTSEEAEEKVHTLARIIARYGVTLHLNVMSFTEVQMRIRQRSPEPYSTILLRACMMRAANMLASFIHSDVIITGESLGQVASQTVENLAVTESFSDFPLFRPLIGLDKEEIVQTARAIGTYETSILPYEDCCVLFSPRHPVLKADVGNVHALYDALEIDGLICASFEGRKTFRYSIQDYIEDLRNK